MITAFKIATTDKRYTRSPERIYEQTPIQYILHIFWVSVPNDNLCLRSSNGPWWVCLRSSLLSNLDGTYQLHSQLRICDAVLHQAFTRPYPRSSSADWAATASQGELKLTLLGSMTIPSRLLIKAKNTYLLYRRQVQRIVIFSKLRSVEPKSSSSLSQQCCLNRLFFASCE